MEEEVVGQIWTGRRVRWGSLDVKSSSAGGAAQVRSNLVVGDVGVEEGSWVRLRRRKNIAAARRIDEEIADNGRKGDSVWWWSAMDLPTLREVDLREWIRERERV
ncbi:hypothetical protein KSP39_PZI021846 [Platanthera zijinensis]|uniref:Uncharacterized protein n=1 Tax=Platanthera zijinensis TaxID=2320716 RepID=A0AAP0AYN7_9ASPA